MLQLAADARMGNRVVAAVVLFGTIPLTSPKVTDYSIRRQQVAELQCDGPPHGGMDRTAATGGISY